MAIAYRSNSYVSAGASVYYVDVAKPSGLANGDVLLLFVLEQSSSDYRDHQSGFTFIKAATEWSLYRPVLTAFWRYVAVAANEPANYRIYTEGDDETMTVILAAYSGVHSTNPIVGASAYAMHDCGRGSTNKALDVPVTNGGITVLCGAGEGSTNWGSPGGYTERRDTASGYGSMLLADHAAYATNGYSGTLQFQSTAAVYNRSIHIGLRIGNSAPNAPGLWSPASGSTIDRSIPSRFVWTFSDPDTGSGDRQSAYQIRYKLTSASTWTEVAQVQSPNSIHDFAGGTFAEDDYEWQVCTTDQGNLTGPWSGSYYFTGGAPPAGPAITSPANSSNVAEEQVVVWSVPLQDSWQMRTVADNAGNPDTGTVYTDTGEVAEAATRVATATFAVNGRWEHIQVRIKYNSIWSSWSSVRVQVQYTPPKVPTFTLVSQPDMGAIDVVVVNDAPFFTPDVLYNEIYVDDGDGNGLVLKTTDETQSSTWRYYTAVSGRDYTQATIRVRSIGDNGMYSWSDL